MAKETADDRPIPDRASPPGSSSASVNLPIFGETKEYHAPANNEATTKNQVDKMETNVDRPTSPASTTNPWSTSATLPVSSELEPHDHAREAELTALRGEHATSPTPWSTSATLPVSPEDESHEDEAPAEAEATTTAPVEEKKKEFSKAEYQVAFKHFLRIFSYSTWGDRLLLFAACFASICTGVTLPLMNVVFGTISAQFENSSS
jgi:hypothetical protein